MGHYPAGFSQGRTPGKQSLRFPGLYKGSPETRLCGVYRPMGNGGR